MTKRKIILPLLALIPIAWFALKPSSKEAEPKQTLARPALNVDITQPQWQDWPQTLKLQGPLSAWQEALVSAEISAVAVTSVLVDVGSKVHKGQVLATLNNKTLLAEVATSQAQLDTAQAQLRQAKADADRARQLKDRNVLSAQQIQQLEIAEQVAEAGVKSAQAQLGLSQIRLSQTKILAADDGVIASRSVSLGEVISTGQELFRLVRQNRIEWRAELDSSQLSQVKPGMVAQVAIDSEHQVTGRVRQVSPTLARDSRMALAYVEIPTDSGAQAGAYASGEIQLGNKPALSLPASAITWRDGRSLVFILRDERVAETPVVCGRTSDDRIEIVSGLDASAQVVASGGAFLHDGDLIRLSN